MIKKIIGYFLKSTCGNYLLFLASCLLLKENITINTLAQQAPVPSLLKEIFENNKISFGHQLGTFINISMLGAKARIDPILQQDLNIFYLQHILSPSAIHLAPLFIILKYFFKHQYFIMFKIAIIPIFLTVSSLIHPAVTRYLHVEILHSISQILFPHKKLSNIALLFSSLLFDYYFGSYQASNLSFYYSYVLLGHLYLLGPHLGPWLSLIIGQLSLQIGSGMQINLITSLVGFIFGLFFGFINAICLCLLTCQYLVRKALTGFPGGELISNLLDYSTAQLYELFFEFLRQGGKSPQMMIYAGREDILYLVLLLLMIRYYRVKT